MEYDAKLYYLICLNGVEAIISVMSISGCYVETQGSLIHLLEIIWGKEEKRIVFQVAISTKKCTVLM